MGYQCLIEIKKFLDTVFYPCTSSEDLRQFELKMMVPGHCTGWRAVHALLDAFGDEVVIPSAVGRRHEFVADVAVPH